MATVTNVTNSVPTGSNMTLNCFEITEANGEKHYIHEDKEGHVVGYDKNGRMPSLDSGDIDAVQKFTFENGTILHTHGVSIDRSTGNMTWGTKDTSGNLVPDKPAATVVAPADTPPKDTSGNLVPDKPAATVVAPADTPPADWPKGEPWLSNVPFMPYMQDAGGGATINSSNDMGNDINLANGRYKAWSLKRDQGNSMNPGDLAAAKDQVASSLVTLKSDLAKLKASNTPDATAAANKLDAYITAVEAKMGTSGVIGSSASNPIVVGNDSESRVQLPGDPQDPNGRTTFYRDKATGKVYSVTAMPEDKNEDGDYYTWRYYVQPLNPDGTNDGPSKSPAWKSGFDGTYFNGFRENLWIKDIFGNNDNSDKPVIAGWTKS